MKCSIKNTALPHRGDPTRAAYKKPDKVTSQGKHIKVIPTNYKDKPPAPAKKVRKRVATNKSKERKERPRTVWTDERLDKLCQLWNEGLGMRQIAEQLGTTPASTETMIDRMQEVGRIKPRYIQRHYTPEEDAEMIRLRKQGISYEKIGMQIGRGGASISARLKRLGKT